MRLLYRTRELTCNLFAPSSSRLSAQGAAILKGAEQGETGRLILSSIWLCHCRRILAALCLQLLYSGVQFAGPLFLNQIVKFITQPTELQTVGPHSLCALGCVGVGRRMIAH